MKRRRAAVTIIVGGQNVTSKVDPYLISVVVVDKMGSETDTCDLELDDSDGRMGLPAPGESVSVSMGWEGEGSGNVFGGTITEVESGFARRGGGRRLWVHAESINNFGPGKEPLNMSMGEGDLPDQETGSGPPIPFSAFAAKLAGAGGYSALIDPALGAMMRPYWNVGGASPHHALQDLARQMGGFVKFMNDKVAIVGALTGLNAVGLAMGNVSAVWGKNLISWRVKPFIARPMFAGGKSDYFQIIKGAWDMFQGGFANGGGTGASANAAQPNAGANQMQSEQQAGGGLNADSTNESGSGWVMFDGEPAAKGGGRVTISGARPGVDGTWTISEAEHHYSRASGYITRCNLMDPGQGGRSEPEGHGWVPQEGAKPLVEPNQPQAQVAPAAPAAPEGIEI